MDGLTIVPAMVADAQDLLHLQRLAYQSEAELYNDWSIPPLTQTLASLQDEFADAHFLKALVGDRLVGSVRAKLDAGCCAVGRLIVHPEFQRRGIGSRLLTEIEATFPEAVKFELFTGSRSEGNLRLYQKHGYTVCRTQVLSPQVTLVYLEKPATESSTPART